jgi:hypothetical protein
MAPGSMVELGHMQTIRSSSSRLRIAIALLFVALPALAFYLLLWKTAVDLPLLDDYDAPIGLGIRLAQIHGLVPRLLLLLTYEHNGYKLIFEDAVFLAQYSLFGHMHIAPLLAMGNAFSLLIFCAAAWMFKPAAGDPATRLLLLIPLSCIIFQLQYASALNFAECSLQNLAVVAFSLLVIRFATRTSHGSFAAASCFFLLAIASSPNGFFLAPVVIAICIQYGQWRRVAAWLALTGGMLAVYLFRYTHAAILPGADTMPSSGPHINLVYALSFLGAAAARYTSIAPSVTVGLLLCALAALAVKRRYHRQNPAVFYSIVFVLINAVAISGLRADLGVAQSLASRYRIYSSLMLAFSYMFLAESVVPAWSGLRRRLALAAALAVSALFCAVSDVAGAHFLRQKQIALRASYVRQWQKCASCAAEGPLDVAANPALRRQLDAGIYDVNLPVMREAVRLGVYQPPQRP